MKDWKELKREMEAEIDAIWTEVPKEVRASNRGLFPSLAGSNGMTTGNVVYQVADTYCAGFGEAAKSMEYILENKGYSLKQKKEMFQVLYGGLCERLGAKGKKGAAFLNMPKAWKFYQGIVEAMEGIEKEEELASVYWSFRNYMKRMNMWFSQIFTWEVMGIMRETREVSDYEARYELTLETKPYMEAAEVSRL